MFEQSELVDNIESLRKYAIRLTGNLPDAEDLVQATVLRALEKRHLFQPGTSLLKWTSKMLFNLFVTDYRRKIKFETQYNPESIIARRSVDPPQEKELDLSRVRDAMALLSPLHRKILILICVRGMQYKEVAQSLSIPVGTVRSRLARARNNLQYLMESQSAGKRHTLPAGQRSLIRRRAAA